MKRRLVYAALLILLVTSGAFSWLVGTEAGLQWLYHQASPHIPGKLQLASLSGKLFGRIKLVDVIYQLDNQSIEVQQVDFDWNVRALLAGKLQVRLIQLDQLDIRITPSDTATETTLPEIKLPFTIDLQQITVRDIHIFRGDEIILLNQLNSAVLLSQTQLLLDHFEVESDLYRFNFSGTAVPSAALPHDLNLDWRVQLNSDQYLQGSGNLSGDWSSTRLTQKVVGAVELNLDMQLDEPLTQTTWKADVELTRFDSREFGNDLPVLAGTLQLSAYGNLVEAAANGHLNLSDSPYGKLQTDFNLQQLALTEDANGVNFKQLNFKVLQGEVATSGQFFWQPQLRWQAEVSADAIDPGVIEPDWRGDISARMKVAGAVTERGPELQLDLKSLTGKLRDYPVTMRCRLDWKDEALFINDLEAISNNTRIGVDGRVDGKLDLRWSIVSKDLAELYPAARGHLNAKGSLDGSREKPLIKARLQGADIVFSEFAAGQIEADANLAIPFSHPEQIPLEKFNIRLQGHGLQWRDIRVNEIEVKADERVLQARVDTPGVNADLKLTGDLKTEGWRGSLSHMQLRTEDYGSWKLKAPAALEIALEQSQLETFCLINEQQAGICAAVKHDESSNHVKLDLQSIPVDLLKTWLPANLSVSSRTNASARLVYTQPQGLRGEVDIELLPGQVDYSPAPDQQHHIAFEHARLHALLADSGIDSHLDIKLTGDDTIRGSFSLPDARLPGLDFDNQQIQGKLNLHHNQLNLFNVSTLRIENLRGRLAAELAIDGPVRKPGFSGQIQLRDTSLYLPLADLTFYDIDLSARSSRGEQISYQANARLADGIISLNGNTRLDAEAGWPGKIKLNAEKIALNDLFKPYLPADLRIEGVASAKAELALQANRHLLADVELLSDQGALSYPLTDNEMGRWPYRDISLKLRADRSGIAAVGKLHIGENRLGAKLNLPQANPLDLDTATQALEGAIEVFARDFSLLETLIPDLAQPRGNMQADLKLSGTLAQPSILGRADFRLSSLLIPRLGLSVSDINLQATSDETEMLKFHGSAKSGDGIVRLTGEGQLNAAQGWPVKMRISGDNFEAIRIPEANVILSPDLSLNIANQLVDVQGEISIPFARLRPADVGSAARVSSDTVIVGEQQQKQANWQINSNIRLLLGDRVNLFAYGFDGRLGGNLVIEETQGQPARGVGEITIVEGRYRAYGQHLDIEQGRLLFTGGPLSNPGLDIRAIRKTPDVVAGIKVTGRLQQPKLDLFSIPAVGQTDTLSYLLTGGPLDSATSGQGAMIANAALALKLSGGDQIARSIGDRFGFDEMRVESDSTGDQASLVVGRYLSPRLYIGYGIGLVESINSFNLRYQISDRWQLEAESGADQGADLFYRFER